MRLLVPTVPATMATRGHLLALIEGAPGGLRTLEAAITTWEHRQRAARARARAAELHGDTAGGSGGPGPTSALVGAPWSPGEDGGTGGDGGPRGYDADAASLAIPHWPPPRPGRGEAADGDVLLSWYVAVAPPDRWRVVGRGQVAVSDGRRSWVGTSTLVTERDSGQATIDDAGVIGACLHPGRLLDGLELGPPDRDQMEGRPCWVVGAAPGAGLAGAAPRPHALRLHELLAGVEHRLWFDAATGILLCHEGFVDGEPCSTTRLTDLLVDAELPETEFRPPPGAVVRSRHELLRDHLAEMGVDPDSVDLDDPAQVRAALRGTR